MRCTSILRRYAYTYYIQINLSSVNELVYLAYDGYEKLWFFSTDPRAAVARLTIYACYNNIICYAHVYTVYTYNNHNNVSAVISNLNLNARTYIYIYIYLICNVYNVPNTYQHTVACYRLLYRFWFFFLRSKSYCSPREIADKYKCIIIIIIHYIIIIIGVHYGRYRQVQVLSVETIIL